MKDNMSIFAMYNVTGAAVIPPAFQRWWDSKVVNVGDTATIEHEIFGNPIDPTKIRWQRKVDNRVEDIDDDYFTEDIYKDRLYFNPNLDGLNAQMQLSNIQRTDRSEFIILVENAYGQTNYTTLLRVKAAIDALWPCLGIIIEVVLLVIIIYIFERRRAKKEEMEEDENRNSYGMTVMPNSGEDNLRTRKNN
uniref:Neuroplastin n=1 Tax=Romanomermis culicivorax TaxID=13658 RepID=A0A915JZF1_ROMCU